MLTDMQLKRPFQRNLELVILLAFPITKISVVEKNVGHPVHRNIKTIRKNDTVSGTRTFKEAAYITANSSILNSRSLEINNV